MEKFDVIDNFLPEKDWESLSNKIFSPEFPWHYGDFVNYDNSENYFQFEHLFFRNFKIFSEHYEQTVKLFTDRLPIRSISRMKANLLTRTSSSDFHGWHVDGDINDSDMITGIYYINSTNGKTLFKNGKEIDCIANRLVVFPGNLIHSSTSCTDQKVRVVINLNWF